MTQEPKLTRKQRSELNKAKWAAHAWPKGQHRPRTRARACSAHKASLFLEPVQLSQKQAEWVTMRLSLATLAHISRTTNTPYSTLQRFFRRPHIRALMALLARERLKLLLARSLEEWLPQHGGVFTIAKGEGQDAKPEPTHAATERTERGE